MASVKKFDPNLRHDGKIVEDAVTRKAMERLAKSVGLRNISKTAKEAILSATNQFVTQLVKRSQLRAKFNGKKNATEVDVSEAARKMGRPIVFFNSTKKKRPSKKKKVVKEETKEVSGDEL